MLELINGDHETCFSDILHARRSVKAFQATKVGKDTLVAILKSGIIAPFAAIPAAGTDDFRKFVVVSTESAMYDDLSKLVDSKIVAMEAAVRGKSGDIPYAAMLKQAGAAGIKRIIGKAPTLVICAERKGFPENSRESLSFCIQTMWLTAISLKIGFRFIAILSQIELENEVFLSNLVGYEPGTYSVSCFLLGYPEESFIPPQVTYPRYEKIVSFYN